MLELLGLPASHVGAALASFGFYGLFPNSKLSFRKINYNYYPVLQDFDDVDSLVKILCDNKTWVEVFKLNYNPEIYVNRGAGNYFYDLNEFNRILDIDDDLALAYGTNQQLTHNNADLVVGRTPFFTMLRNVKFVVELKKLIDTVCQSPDRVTKHLTSELWEIEPGKHFGFFQMNYAADPVNQTYTKKTTDSKERTVPILCLLALASLKLFPCYVKRGKVTAIGWDSDNNFCYPVFTKPWNKDRFLNTISNPELANKNSKYKNKDLRLAWRCLGVNDIYKANQKSMKQKTYTSYYFAQSYTL